MNRLEIFRQRTTSLLAITPEKDTHVQNREHDPLNLVSDAVCFRLKESTTVNGTRISVGSLAWPDITEHHLISISYRG